MKKYLSFMAIAAMFAACQPNDELGSPFQAGQEVTLCANMPNSGSNSAQPLPAKKRVSGLDAGTQINLTWDADDVILVKVGDKTAQFTLESGAGLAQATFRGTMPADGTSYSVQYPVAEPDLSSQTYVANGFGKGLMKMVTETNGTIDGGFTLKAQNALLGLQLTGDQAVGKIVVTNPADSKTYTLNCSDVTLSATATLFYLVLPAGEWANGFKTTVYASDDSELAEFSTSNLITFSATSATVMPAKEVVVDAHDYVDLGLPSGLKWATCNVGAENPEEYGDYFAWGETKPKEEYNSTTYSYNSNPSILPLSNDAASVNWGGSWRMPTEAEWTELIKNCTWTWSTQNSIKGFLVKGNNGNTIFIPAAGNRYKKLHKATDNCYYWSSTLDNSSPSYSYGAWLNSNRKGVDGVVRNNGLSVRPVRL